MDAEFVIVIWFGHWIILEDLIQPEALHVLVDLAWPLNASAVCHDRGLT